MFFINAEVGFVVGYDGNIFKTVNSGSSWQKQQSGTTLPLVSVFFLNDTIGYISGQGSSGCLDADCGKGAVLLKTLDGGKTWTKTFFKEYASIYSLLFFDEVRGLSIIRLPDASNSESYFLAKTFDGGSSWELLDLTITEYTKFYSIDNIVFVAGKDQDIFKSKDFGNSWQTIHTPTSVLGNVYFINENTGFFNSATGIYKTIDGGLHWQIATFPFSKFDFFHFYSEAEGFNIGMVTAYEGGDFPTFKGSYSYNTYDSGEYWEQSSLEESLFFWLAYFPQKDLGYSVGSSQFYTIKRK